MAPQFNLLKGRFVIAVDDYVYGSQSIQEGRTWLALIVRKGALSCYEPRKVKGYLSMVVN